MQHTTHLTFARRLTFSAVWDNPWENRFGGAHDSISQTLALEIKQLDHQVFST
jgi:hypothetical protein